MILSALSAGAFTGAAFASSMPDIFPRSLVLTRRCLGGGVPWRCPMAALLTAALALATGPLIGADAKAKDTKTAKDAKATKTQNVEVLLSADAISVPEGLRPKPGKPISYLFGQTRESLGELVGKVKYPEPAVVERAVVAELTKQGFVRAKAGGARPALFIMAIVGDANFKEPNAHFDNPEFRQYAYMIGSNLRRLFAAQGLEEQLKVDFEELINENGPIDDVDLIKAREIIRAETSRLWYEHSQQAKDKGRLDTLIGARKVMHAIGEGTMAMTDAERIASAVSGDSMFVSLEAYDAASLAKKDRVLLWRTTMLIDWRDNLTQSLSTMLAHAGPLFGTDVRVPGLVDDRTRNAEVKVGEATVVPGEKAAPATTQKK